VSYWTFSNVTVEQIEYPHCYHGAMLQVGKGGVGTTHTLARHAGRRVPSAAQQADGVDWDAPHGRRISPAPRPLSCLQGSVTPTSVAKVSTGEQLLQQLNNNTARCAKRAARYRAAGQGCRRAVPSGWGRCGKSIG
jgi:hypothetical protein